MRREDVQKLLGGYAAGTLTAEERRALFEAALTDQALFEALAEEEPLRDALADPDARAQVAAALRAEPPSLRERWTAGWRLHRSWAYGAAGVAATAVLVGAIAIGTGVWRKPVAERQELALLRPPPAPLAEPASQAPKAREEQPAPQVKVVPAPVPRQFTPPVAIVLKKEKAVIAESPAPALEAASAPPAGVVGGVVVAPPPPPAPAPVSLSSSVAPGARALFHQAETGSKAEMSRDNLLDREQDRVQRAEKRVRALNAPTRQVGDLGLRYSLMRRGPDGRESEAPLDTVLERGEAARLRIEVNQAANLSVTADRAVLFAGMVAPGVPTFVDARPGKIRILLSRQAAGFAAGGFASGASDARADQPVATEKADEAVYVVNTGAAANPRVLAEVELKYR